MRRALWGVVAMLVFAPAASAHVGDPLQLTFEWPAEGTVTTPFGWTEGRYHPGLDIGILRSLTLYAHLASVGVRPGDWVTAGEPLGVAGCTGWCTGTHLHFEVRARGRAVDPLPLLP